ncbi:MAG: pyrimidine 5'-nucleotidase [Alphaproteobacteria bacterium]|nr:pyrimidine 5'-nucleotidase [Alphaproteobacteria bacterium]
MKHLSHIDTWVFDLDGTLYDAATHVFDTMHDHINAYVAETLNITTKEADQKRYEYFKKHGTTLRGMMAEHGTDPDHFLECTHGMDISHVPVCTITAEKIALLPGRKLIHTNASRKWAENMLAHLELAHLFEGIFAIEDAQYMPKPAVAPYQDFLKQYNINPKTACMFEDMAVNLKTAHDLGMSTVWLHYGKDAAHDYVHDKDETLAAWLSRPTEYTEEKRVCSSSC